MEQKTIAVIAIVALILAVTSPAGDAKQGAQFDISEQQFIGIGATNAPFFVDDVLVIPKDTELAVVMDETTGKDGTEGTKFAAHVVPPFGPDFLMQQLADSRIEGAYSRDGDVYLIFPRTITVTGRKKAPILAEIVEPPTGSRVKTVEQLSRSKARPLGLTGLVSSTSRRSFELRPGNALKFRLVENLRLPQPAN